MAGIKTFVPSNAYNSPVTLNFDPGLPATRTVAFNVASWYCVSRSVVMVTSSTWVGGRATR